MTTCGLLSEYIIQKKWLSRTATRKAFVAVAQLGSATCMFLVPLVGCNEKAVIGLLAMASLFIGMMSGGDIPIPSELTNHFPATVYSMMNMVAMSSGFITPSVVGFILESSDDILSMWRCVFWMASGISVTACTVFLIFGSADIQDFDRIADDRKHLTSSTELDDEFPTNSGYFQDQEDNQKELR